MENQCFRVNSPSVIYEQFDGELVAIHLDSGAYFSLLGVGADAFRLLAEEATPVELAETLSTKYDANAAEILKALLPFLSALESDKLIAKVEIRRQRDPLALHSNGAKLPFGQPSLESYHDLQSLFLLDPIHDVGEQGWPQSLEGSQGDEGVRG